jgi:hypothetical protein
MMKYDLIFLQTGEYRGMVLGDSIEKLKQTLKDLFHNSSDGDTEIYSDDAQTEFIFIHNELCMIVLKSFEHGFLSPKFSKMIKKLHKKGIAWHFYGELTLLDLVAIRIEKTSVDLIFGLDHNNELVLGKAGLYKIR